MHHLQQNLPLILVCMIKKLSLLISVYSSEDFEGQQNAVKPGKFTPAAC